MESELSSLARFSSFPADDQEFQLILILYLSLPKCFCLCEVLSLIFLHGYCWKNDRELTQTINRFIDDFLSLNSDRICNCLYLIYPESSQQTVLGLPHF